MKRSGVLVAAAFLGAALVASEPAAAFHGGGGGFHGGFGGFHGGFGGFGGGFGGFHGSPMFAGRSAAVGAFEAAHPFADSDARLTRQRCRYAGARLALFRQIFSLYHASKISALLGCGLRESALGMDLDGRT